MDSALSTAATERPDRRPGWRLLGQIIWTQRAGIALGVGAGVLWTGGKVAVPMLVRKAIDQGISRGSNAEAVHWALLVAAAGVVAAVFTGLRRYMAFHEGRRAEADLRVRIFAHLQRLQFAFHDRVATGELMSRSHSDLLQIQNLISQIPLTISHLVVVIAVTTIMSSIDPLLTLLALGSLPFVNYLGRRFSTRLHPAVRGLAEQTAELASVVEESVAGVRVIKGFGAERVQQARLEKEAGDVYEMAMRAAFVRSTYMPAIELVPSLGMVLVLGYGGHRVLDGALSLGTLVMFNFYVLLLVNPLRSLGQVIAMAERAANAADRATQVLTTEPVIVDAASPVALPAGREGRGDVWLRGVSFGYGGPDAARVLSDFELRVRAGESVAIVGETGCGKSTAAKLIPRFYDVDRGTVTIDGIDVRTLSLHELRGQVGIVFEDTFLFSDTVASNIAFANPEAEMAEVERAARLAGAHEFIVALPDGYETTIGERGFSLSGGQRQRIAIARAILADPRVLILDDATSSVDPEKEHEIRAAMAEVMRGRTTIVIAHRPVTIALADRVVLLAGGRIVAQGTHEELLRTNAAYQTVLAAASPSEVAS
jgi:ATP-binding cassette subfamily B protein